MEIGWIDFSRNERSKIYNVLDLISEKGTVDEIGVSLLRDGFSDKLFPGTSTIHTRAKYFFIIPYIAKQIESYKITEPETFLTKLDKIEEECVTVLDENNPGAVGIIGKRSLHYDNKNNHKWIKRAPSEIYWSALKKYGILKKDITRSEYAVKICSENRNKMLLCDNKTDYDDYDAGLINKSHLWNIKDLYKNNWNKNLDINLTKKEAEFLKNQIIINCKNSMLAYVLENNAESFIKCKDFENLDTISFPGEIEHTYRLAVKVSKFIFVLMTVYNMSIPNSKNKEAVEIYEVLKPNLLEIANIDFDEVFKNIELKQTPSLEIFLKYSKDAMIKEDIEKLKTLVINREVQLKGEARAKTKNPGINDNNKWIGNKLLNYRLPYAQNLINDILKGLAND